MKKIAIRFSIIVFWVILIFVFLYSPHMDIFPRDERSINIFTWGDTIHPEILSKFEKETGIKVRLSYYATNEELQVKMRATGGEGYDLVMPSDYTVAILQREGLLKPLKRSKLSFWNRLNPALLGHVYDPENRYSIPFLWEVYGLGYNREFFPSGGPLPSWRSLYDPEIVQYRIAMKNDPIENICLASLYLFRKNEPLTEQEFASVKQLILKQREWVEAYSDFRADYFIATGSCPIALTSSPLVKRMKPLFPKIAFALPREGSFVTIENFCIPKASKKEKYTYQLLAYLFSEESGSMHYSTYGYFPAIFPQNNELDVEPYEEKLLKYTRDDFDEFMFFRNLVSQKEARNFWVELKSF